MNKKLIVMRKFIEQEIENFRLKLRKAQWHKFVHLNAINEDEPAPTSDVAERADCWLAIWTFEKFTPVTSSPIIEITGALFV